MDLERRGVDSTKDARGNIFAQGSEVRGKGSIAAKSCSIWDE